MMSYKNNFCCNSFMLHRVDGIPSKVRAVSASATTPTTTTPKRGGGVLTEEQTGPRSPKRRITHKVLNRKEKDISSSEPWDCTVQYFFRCSHEQNNTRSDDKQISFVDLPARESSRRKCLGTIMTMGTCSISQLFIPTPGDEGTFVAQAVSLPFNIGESTFGGSQRRQLELCLVTIQRMSYWCEKVAYEIKVIPRENGGIPVTDIAKASYLEARLGAKAALTGKVGGGANSQVYTISTFQLRSCIKDVMSYYNEYYQEQNRMALNKDERYRLKQQKYAFDNAAMEVIESLAALVEFDGLDNTQDPSPRSSLTLSQYSDQKGQFVQRTLLERTIPACNVVLDSFGTDKKMFVQKYISQNYPNEEISKLKSSSLPGR